MDGLPDFFRAAGTLPPELDGALEEDGDIDDATFGGFDVPLDGLPDFFQQDLGGPVGGSKDGEMDDLGGITGMSSAGGK